VTLACNNTTPMKGYCSTNTTTLAVYEVTNSFIPKPNIPGLLTSGDLWTFEGYYRTANGVDQITDATGTTYPNTAYTDSNGKWIATNNVTLYAKWIPKEYELFLVNNGKGTTADQTHTVQWETTKSVLFTTPYVPFTAWGYQLDGFTTDPTNSFMIMDKDGKFLKDKVDYNVGGIRYTDTQSRWYYDNTLTLYAKWTASNCNLTFLANDSQPGKHPGADTWQNDTLGCVSFQPVGTTSSPVPTMSHTGYDFGGYTYRNPDGTVSLVFNPDGIADTSLSIYQVIDHGIIQGDLVYTFTALWTPQTYTLHTIGNLNPPNGTPVPDIDVTVTYEKTNSIYVPTPVAGYTFSGWFFHRDDWTITDRLTNQLGNFLTNAYDPDDIHDNTITYSTNNWGDSLFLDSTYTVYAWWVPDQYSMTITQPDPYSLGPSQRDYCPLGPGPYICFQTVTVGVTFGEKPGLSDPTLTSKFIHDGYDFLGIYEWDPTTTAHIKIFNSDLQNLDKTTTYFDTGKYAWPGDISLTASYSPKLYTVSIFANDDLTNPTVDSDTTVTFEATNSIPPLPDVPGWDFDGYFSLPDTSNPAYRLSDKYGVFVTPNLVSPKGGELTNNDFLWNNFDPTQTIYAGWKAKTYTVDTRPTGDGAAGGDCLTSAGFSSNYGTPISAGGYPTFVGYYDASGLWHSAGIPATKPGFNFGGWFSDSAITETFSEVVDGTHTLHYPYHSWLTNLGTWQNFTADQTVTLYPKCISKTYHVILKANDPYVEKSGYAPTDHEIDYGSGNYSAWSDTYVDNTYSAFGNSAYVMNKPGYTFDGYWTNDDVALSGSLVYKNDGTITEERCTGVIVLGSCTSGSWVPVTVDDTNGKAGIGSDTWAYNGLWFNYDSTQTLYAHWTPKEYEITIHTNVGAHVDSSLPSANSFTGFSGNSYENDCSYDVTVTFETTNSLAKPECDLGGGVTYSFPGYTFKGYYLDPGLNYPLSDDTGEFLTSKADTNQRYTNKYGDWINTQGAGSVSDIYAKWDASTISVYFDPNYRGQTNGEWGTLTYDARNSASAVPVLTLPGYTFAGYTTKEHGCTPDPSQVGYDLSKAGTSPWDAIGNLWIEQPLCGDDPSLTVFDSSRNNTNVTSYVSDILRNVDYYRTINGYWKDDSPKGSNILYAQWMPLSYTLTLNADQLSSILSTTSAPVVYDTTDNISSYVWSSIPNGYFLKGFYDKPYGSSPAGVQIVDANGDFTDGTNCPSGWADNVDRSTGSAVSSDPCRWHKTSNATVYAYWDVAVYTIDLDLTTQAIDTFATNSPLDSSGIGGVISGYNATYSVTTQFDSWVPEGYTFAGYYYDSGFTCLLTDNATPSAHLKSSVTCGGDAYTDVTGKWIYYDLATYGITQTLYAKYNPKTYPVKLYRNLSTTDGTNQNYTATFGLDPDTDFTPGAPVPGTPGGGLEWTGTAGLHFDGYWTDRTTGTQVFDSAGNRVTVGLPVTDAGITWLNPSGNWYNYASGQTLYAHWTTAEYDLNLEHWGVFPHTYGNDLTTVTYMTKPGCVTPPTLPGYTFADYTTLWNGTTTVFGADGCPKLSVSQYIDSSSRWIRTVTDGPAITAGLDGTFTLFAKWSADNLTFDVIGNLTPNNSV